MKRRKKVTLEELKLLQAIFKEAEVQVKAKAHKEES